MRLRLNMTRTAVSVTFLYVFITLGRAELRSAVPFAADADNKERRAEFRGDRISAASPIWHAGDVYIRLMTIRSETTIRTTQTFIVIKHLTHHHHIIPHNYQTHLRSTSR